MFIFITHSSAKDHKGLHVPDFHLVIKATVVAGCKAELARKEVKAEQSFMPSTTALEPH